VNKLLPVLLALAVRGAFAQDFVHSSTLTLGAGGTPYSDNALYPGIQTGGPAFSGNYEFRISKFLAVEGGTDILLPSGLRYRQTAVLAGSNLLSYYVSPCCSMVGMISTERSRVTFLNYGVKGILPLANERLELFAGIGGAYEWNSMGGYLSGVLAQAHLGARVAVDRGRRFWLGTTLRGYGSFGQNRQDFVPLTFDFGVRFGR
jgi:hypothetical protein